MSTDASRRQVLLGSGLILAGLATGCRSDNVGQPTPGSGPSSSGEPTIPEPEGIAVPERDPSPQPEDLVGGPSWTPPDLTGTTLIMWGLNYAPHVDRYRRLAAQFEELTGATVKVQPQDDPGGTLMTAIAGKNPPDVICNMGKGSDQLVRRKGILALDDLVFGALNIDMEKWWLKGAIDAYAWDGQHFGVPVESSGLGYAVTGRRDLIDKASSTAQSMWPGAAPESEWPTNGVYFESYEQLWELAKELQQTKGEKVDVWGYNRQGWYAQSLNCLMFQQDVIWWNSESGTFNLDNEACVKGLETMVTIPYAKGIETKLAVGSQVSGYLAKQVALAIGGMGIAGEAAKLEIPSATVMLPSQLPGKTPVFMGEGGWGFEVPVDAKNKDAAIEFAKFMTTYEAQFTFSQIYGGGVPACRAIMSSAIYQDDSEISQGLRRCFFALEDSVYQGNGYDPQCEGILGEIVETLQTGKVTAAEASKEMQKQLTAQQKRYIAAF